MVATVYEVLQCDTVPPRRAHVHNMFTIIQFRGVGTRGARGAGAPLLKKVGGQSPPTFRASGNGVLNIIVPVADPDVSLTIKSSS